MFKSRVLAVKWKLSFSSPISKPTPMILLVVLFIRKLFVVLSANITVLTSWGLADVSMEHRLRFAHLCASQLWESVFLLWSSIEEKKKERKKGDDKCTGLESEVLWEYLDRNSITRREWEQRWRERAPGFFFFIWFYLFIFTPSARIDFWRGNCSVVWCLWVTPCSAERRRGRNFPEINEKEEYIFLALRHKVHTALKRACLCSQL